MKTSDKNKTSKNMPSKSPVSNVLHFYRNRIMNILIFVVLLCYFICRIADTVPDEIQRCYDLLAENVEQVKQYQQYSSEADGLYTTIQDEDYLSACCLFIRYIENGDDIEECIDQINDLSDEYDSVFYLKSDGTLISPSDRESLELSEEEKRELLDSGSLHPRDGSIRYYALACGSDTMIARIDESCVEHFSMDVLDLSSLNGFIYNDASLDITQADEKIIPANFDAMFKSAALDNGAVTNADPDLELAFISPYKEGISKITNMKLAVISKLSYQLKGYSICVYIPLSEIISNILVKSGLPTLLCLAFIFLNVFGSLHFRRVVQNTDDAGNAGERTSKTIQLPFGCHIDIPLARHIIFMQVFMGLLVIACSIIMLTLSRFSLSYEDGKYSIEQLIGTDGTCREALDECWDVFTEPAKEMAGAVAAYIGKGDVRSDADIQESLKELTDSTFLEEISIYDRNGENIYTTSDSVGYPLSTDPDSEQNQFWELLSGSRQSVLTRSSSEDGLVYYAIRRSDEIGIVLLTFSDKGFGELERKLSPESAAASLKHRNSYVFMDEDETESTDAVNTCYKISASGGKISCGNPDLPYLANGESFCGFRDFGSRQYFVIGIGDESRTIFYLDSVSEILSGLTGNIVTLIIFLAIICLLDLTGCAVFADESADYEENEQKKNRHKALSHHIIGWMEKKVTLTEEMADSHRTIWRHCFYNTVCLIAVTLLLDYLLNNNSMLIFLFRAKWEKGVNIFAISMIVFAILVTCLLFRLLKYFFGELISNLPPRLSTATQMVHSIINIVIVVCLIVYAANQVGINTATILASVGISGLAIGIAAKDTLNDMINGIFIILDGRIQVGDFVEVGGFYGQVEKIGIRTTKVHRFNQEKSINNSDMNNLLNDSRGMSCIDLTFRVGIDTDLQQLNKILLDAEPRFQAACNGMLKSDADFLGVDSFDADSICCTFWISVEEPYRKLFTYKCRRVLVEVLNENNIDIGSNMVVETENGRRVKFFRKKDDN